MSDRCDKLRILFAVHTPWTEDLGIPRVAIELSRHLEELGNRCHKFSFEDAFPAGVGTVSRFFSLARFQRQLRRFIRRNGSSYDLVHAEHFLLPFPRSSYRFKGKLIAKSNGLEHFYRQYIRDVEKQLIFQSEERGTLGGRVLRRLGDSAAGGLGAAERSFHTADQIHLLNTDELDFVRVKLGHGDKCILIPNGLSEERSAALAASSRSSCRLDSQTIAFIGTWSFRKGKREFPDLVRSVRRRLPAARFRLLGTCVAESTIRSAFHPDDRANVEVVPQFHPDELPTLLNDVRCGAFPSYIEGFGLGALEMLAAGLPVVAWDVPGPRDIAPKIPHCELTPVGQVQPMADKILAMLEVYKVPQNDLKLVDFRWKKIAKLFAEYAKI